MPKDVVLVLMITEEELIVLKKGRDMKKREWHRAEKKDVKLFEAKPQKGSGRVDFYPADSYSNMFVIETKKTDKKSYSIALDKWNKLVGEAAIINHKDKKLRVPIMSIHLGTKRLVVLDFEDLQFLLKTP